MNENSIGKNRPINRLWLGVFVGAVFLSLFVLHAPCVFAQGGSADKTAQDSAKTRQYSGLLGSILEFVHDNYVDEVDPEVLYQGAMKGMMSSLGDPYTTYLSPEMMRDLSDVTKGNFGGVGLSISKPLESTPDKPAYVEVASPIEDTPGWRAGIRSGDYILSIAGTPTPDISLDDAVSLLRGEVGTAVEILIRRGKNMEFPVTLERAIIEVPTVKYGMIGGVGYLRIIEFSRPTADRVQEALNSFAQAGYTSLIIDLRNNPGGLIQSVADVADKFIDSGTIVSTKSRLKFENSVFTASARKTTVPGEMPMVVLINRGSASASEILSGALKDHRLAYLVGARTYGKGSVQQPVPLSKSDGVKITTARYYTPSDTNIDKIGIPPDREIVAPGLTEEEEKAYVSLFNANVIASYVEDRPAMTEKDIAAFAQELQKTYALSDRLLRRLVRNTVNRTRPAELYDLDYDVQLVEALSILRNEDFAGLMKTTKTLKELQDEVQ
ncbi:MAG: S41 family peptidase [Treponema sp.]|jgi:carboxyl-terminal processing protease|nr:S41 family peptidase [Treponema sp.]